MLFEILRNISICLLLIISAWVIPKYSKLQTRVGKATAWFVWFKCLFEIISFTTSLLAIPNLPGFYLYTAIEGIIILEILAFIPGMGWFMRLKRILQILLVAGIAAESIVVWYDKFNIISRMAECVLLFGLCHIALIRMAYSPYLRRIYAMPDFWFLLSVMIGLGSHFFIIQYINYSMAHDSKAEARNLWLFNYVSIIVSNLLLFVGLWVTSKPIRLRN